ncbi:cytochrome c biogenesis protein ResB [Tessaracoccus caeni]|uniref:cytochrome c biogenesis protein ResB n=1 Tax=Tessaracoccus caeni TaxID=3031239 RepID=UPI0023DA7745|nr:cytochrome c biogenesis protein ResB [Tessaracoccus caeni]MDF1487755.1 cytochrome c biogenesis protein ResB [Tessaracoccus caeni]
MSPRAARSEEASALSFVQTLRWMWAQLTSMRTALVLLFLLALASIPGSMIPQTHISAITVSDFQAEHPGWNRILEPLGMYDVYASPWFSATYLLLFVSLAGCIVPRIGKYARDLRKQPPRLPKRVERLPEHAEAEAVFGASVTLDRAEQWLASKRYRIRRTDEGISAERGYLRELGNLVFHISLIVVLTGLAWSNLWGFSGTVVVVEGRGFSNVITQYDDFTTGAMADTDQLEPFSVSLESFRAEFETGDVQRGAARVFDAAMKVTENGETRDHLLTVNEPILTSGGTQVNLQGHGYAPVFTVYDGNGDVAFSGPVVTLPQDGNFASVGVIKANDGRPERLAFEIFFFPTAVLDQTGPHSVFPDALNPEVYLNAWHGPPRQETGEPESVYRLNAVGLEPVLGDDEQVFRAAMKPGASMTLPDGLGALSFDGYSRWIKLQISQTPGTVLSLIAVLVGVAGLCLSLYVRPRRLFLRLTEGGVVVGGLDRTDVASGLAEEVDGLCKAATGYGDDVASSRTSTTKES